MAVKQEIFEEDRNTPLIGALSSLKLENQPSYKLEKDSFGGADNHDLLLDDNSS